MPLDGNPRTYETETKPDVYSLEGLIAWLETQPPEKKYDWADCNGGCLIGQYGKYLGKSMREMCTPLANGEILYRKLTEPHLAFDTPHTFGAFLSRARALLAKRRK